MRMTMIRSVACDLSRRGWICRIIAPELGRDTKRRADPVTDKNRLSNQTLLSHVPHQSTRRKNHRPPLLWPCLYQSSTSQNEEPLPLLCIPQLNVASAHLADNRCNQTRLALPHTCLFWGRTRQNRMNLANHKLTLTAR